MTGRFIEFVVVATALVVIPGPAVILVVRQTIGGGVPAGVWVAAGVFSGNLLWATAAAIGITVLLVASESVFLVIQLLGGLYLIYLGVRSLRLAPASDALTGVADNVKRRDHPYLQGLICDLSNPKTVLAFSSVVPLFMSPGGGHLDALVLGFTFAALGVLSLLAYAFLFGTVGTRVLGAATSRAVASVSGLVLVGLGLALLVHAW